MFIMLIIKKALKKDTDFILQITRENMSSLLVWNDEKFLNNLKIKNIYIVFKDSKKIGLVDCEKTKGNLYIHNLQVNKEFWGQGIGKTIMEYVDNLAKIMKCKKIVFRVSQNNKRAITFYANLGFHYLKNDDNSNGFWEKLV